MPQQPSIPHGLEIRLLGPLEVSLDDEPVALGGGKPRALLADLALHRGQVASSDSLIEDLWGATPPKSAKHALQVYVSQLRGLLDPENAGLIAAHPPGYALKLALEALDVHLFERLVEAGRKALRGGDPSSASASLREALELWRGPALADFVYEPFAQTEIARLEDLRTAVREDLVDAKLELLPSSNLLPEIEALVAENPLDERPRAQLMLALYRAGRQTDALETYRATRRLLVEALGVEPSGTIRELERAILRQDASLDKPSVVSWPTEERRKTVTVLFADLVGSTELADGLDPEAWRRLQERLLATLRAPLERHGGTVEKFIGDAVMAVFGVPTAHEDDPLRALRAAREMRDGMASQNDELEPEQSPLLALRIGINTGEVFAGGPAGGPLVSGSVVNLAKRLEEAAAPGEILLGAGTHALVRHAVATEQLRAHRGDKEGVMPAFLVLNVIEGAPAIARYLRAPLVGRDEEFLTLREIYDDVQSERRCRLVTLVGEPGIGKTRLAAELVASLPEETTVLVGRCVAYGEGATYLPLAEMVRQLEELEVLLAAEDDGELVAERINELIGVVDGSSTSSEEGFWAFRRLSQALVRERPLVLLFEDLHWAEPTLLDLIEHLRDIGDGPILLLCVARPELLDSRPGWVETSLQLTPLPDESSATLVASLPGGGEFGPDARKSIVGTAGGNPLFIEQLFAYVQEKGSESAALPPTINALLTARLDGLREEERIVLERASVEGKVFQRETLVELAPERVQATIGEHLVALVRKGLVQPQSAERGAETLRFHHDLVRDAAYESLPKRTRAELHERLADWLESGGAPDEILGHHLEQAVRSREALELLDEHTEGLAARAAASLLSARSHAFARGDFRAVATLLERAVALLPASSPERRELLPELARSYATVGDWAQAEAAVTEAIQAARLAGDTRQEMHALVVYGMGRHFRRMAPVEDIDPDSIALAQRAIAVFTEHRDDLGLAKAWRLIVIARNSLGQIAAALDAARHQIEHAQRSEAFERPALDSLALGAAEGPYPVPDALRLCDQLLESTKGLSRKDCAAQH
jgi:DNA-binding SARP family transcriptional activator/tetratricopeptide (TPR) repeat protein